jgi:hypothetical protein
VTPPFLGLCKGLSEFRESERRFNPAARFLPQRGLYFYKIRKQTENSDHFGDFIIFKHALITSTAYCNIYHQKKQYLFDPDGLNFERNYTLVAQYVYYFIGMI